MKKRLQSLKKKLKNLEKGKTNAIQKANYEVNTIKVLTWVCGISWILGFIFNPELILEFFITIALIVLLCGVVCVIVAIIENHFKNRK